jgi:hypothetical protein
MELSDRLNIEHTSSSLEGDGDALVVWTDLKGEILEITERAADLLGLSRRAARGRLMQIFVTADRDRVLRAVDIASRGATQTMAVVLKPRERRTVAVDIDLQQAHRTAGPIEVQWTLRRST